MATGRFERSEDGQTWTVIDPQTMRRKLAGTFRDVDQVIKAMAETPMETIRSTYAYYRFNPTP